MQEFREAYIQQTNLRLAAEGLLNDNIETKLKKQDMLIEAMSSSKSTVSKVIQFDNDEANL